MEYNTEKLCQTCLQTSENVNPMKIEDEKLFKRLIVKMDYENKLSLCILCQHMLRKISKFIRQCELAQDYLQSSLEQGYNIPNIEPVFKLTTSEIKTECHGTVLTSTVKDEYNSDEDNLPLVFLTNDNDSEDSNHQRAVSPSHIKDEEVILQNPIDDTKIVSCQLNPVQKKETKVKVKNKRFNKKLYKNKRQRQKTKNEEIPAGFSSRMVRETEEYTVIKLTKEQVLDEMKNNKETNEKYKEAPYKCELCVKYFNFDDVLKGHLEKHSPKNGAFKCEICSQYCPSAVSLRGHMKSHTTKYKCKICHIVRLSRQHILEHYVLHHTEHMPDYRCSACSFTTNKRTVMQRHARTHSESGEHTCLECGRGFKSRETLRVHSTRHDVRKRFPCDACKRSFIFKSLLHKHVRSVHIDKDFYCVECDTKFTSMEALKQHFKRSKKHSDPSHYRYECSLCEEKFLTKARLAHHETSVHSLPKTARCEHCSRVYSGAEALRLHVRRAHPTGESRTEYHCGVCFKVFTRKAGLKVHMRIHTGERPYGCHCGDSFTQQASLRAHQAAKHKK